MAAACWLAGRGQYTYGDDTKSTAVKPVAIAPPANAADAEKVKTLKEMAALGSKAADKINLIEGGLKDPSPAVRTHAALALRDRPGRQGLRLRAG